MAWPSLPAGNHSEETTMTKPGIKNKETYKARERIRRESLMRPSREAYFGFTPKLRLFGGFEEEMGFSRFVTVCLSSKHFEYEKYSYVTAGRGEPPKYNVQRHAGINIPVTWPLAQNGSVTFRQCAISIVNRQNGFSNPARSAHVEIYVEPGDMRVEVGWTSGLLEGPANDFVMMLEDHNPRLGLDGLWFYIRKLP
jgi:hypothetical protein